MNILMPDGRAVFMELAAIADVVVENFGGGVFERMGFGYDVIREVNDDVIFVSMPPSGNGGGPEGSTSATGWRSSNSAGSSPARVIAGTTRR